MSLNQDNIKKEEEEVKLSPLESPITENICIDENESYSCTECSSNIEILSINYNKSEITFKCLNKKEQNNHGIKTMPISKYIKEMQKNTYLYDKCSMCFREQSLIKNFFLLKYCVNCKKIICNECKEIHIKNCLGKHFFINNNERRIKCSIHPEKNNADYCFDCTTHLCNNCLETRKHIEHNTKSLLQFIPSNNEKKRFQQCIEELNERKKTIENERKNEINEYNNKLNEYIKVIKDEYEKKIKSDEIKEKNEIELNENKKSKELEELKRKYKEEEKQIMNKYQLAENNIKNNHKKSKDNFKKDFNEKRNGIQNKFLHNIHLEEKDEKINKLNALITIHEIIKKTQEKYSNNYFNNVNFINVISSFVKNKNKVDNNDNVSRMKEVKCQSEKKLFRKDDIKINSNKKSLIINQINNNNYENELLNKKLKNENDKLSSEIKKLKNENQKLKKENLDLKEKHSISMNKQLNSPKSNSTICSSIKKEKRSIKRNNDDIINNSRDDSMDFKQKNTKIFSSYCPTDIDNSFVIFDSILNKKQYIIYSDMNKIIYCHNLSDNKIEQMKKHAHVEPISNFSYYYYYNKKYVNEYIMSLSYRNNQIKIWNFKNWEEIVNIKKIYKEGYLYSSCFLYFNYNLYFLTSNYEESKSPDLIRLYNLKGEMINTINESNDNVYLMNSYFDKDKSINYIITSHQGYIKSYDFNKNKLYCKYQEKNNYSNIYSYIINKDDGILKIIESSDNGFIRIWDFYTGNLYSKFEVKESRWIGGICLYNQDYLLVGCGDKTIKVIRLKEGEVIKSLSGHNGKVCSIKKINIPHLGSCIFSIGKDNKIRRWINILE